MTYTSLKYHRGQDYLDIFTKDETISLRMLYPDDEGEKLAKLLVAAPDLLRLLAEGESRAQDVENADDIGSAVEDLLAWAQDARKAIAKATK